MPQTFGLIVRAVDECLKVALQMSPTPLQPMPQRLGSWIETQRPIHFGAVTLNRARELAGQQIVQNRGRAGQTNAGHSKPVSHEGPQPGFLRLLFGRRFIDTQLCLMRKLINQFFVGRLQRGGSQILVLHCQARATRLAQQRFEELGGAAFALTKIGQATADAEQSRG